MFLSLNTKTDVAWFMNLFNCLFIYKHSKLTVLVQQFWFIWFQLWHHVVFHQCQIFLANSRDLLFYDRTLHVIANLKTNPQQCLLITPLTVNNPLTHKSSMCTSLFCLLRAVVDSCKTKTAKLFSNHLSLFSAFHRLALFSSHCGVCNLPQHNTHYCNADISCCFSWTHPHTWSW